MKIKLKFFEWFEMMLKSIVLKNRERHFAKKSVKSQVEETS